MWQSLFGPGQFRHDLSSELPNAIRVTGELYMPGDSAADDAIRTSSIKDRPVRAGFSEFTYGPEMLGPVPDMTKGDE